MLQLFGYWRSSASFRVRLVLQLKGLGYEQHPVNLRQGEQKEKAYRRVNPQGLVPFLIDGDVQLGQSVAIMEYLDETYPAYPLMPSAPEERARVRQIVNMIACDTHPLNNLRVLNYLEQELGQSKTARDAWYRHWIDETFTALEQLLMTTAGVYCVGNEVTLADCMLVPQVYNARRFNMTLDDYPTIARIVANCEQLQAFIKAAPANQPDAQA
ncbi:MULTISPECIES: maleylacetoacetate isomerase [Aeromonas]|uniref:Maleylacetoacetate isomerase n=1 Tax=Aeromonas media TaxID=651 RepID=A0A6M4YBH0_AERME|nr:MULTISPECIES: maleylacetoacetate isomerase [Aeromonas]MCE9945012.1 maleylacetoacetate isomerase [Aeromonas rivipollensis]MDM5123395.1 maleylacetoacetate isomerase [Aeromonas rivipollensis]NEX83700.1 maleylacetoacetate isomerase [Aeromonas rivipollensis]QJT22330.1 maleylacetoacetate isomerase [Aeromonas media]QYK82749.1 maleylacetoacetate isomerase [Aeromonas media]